MKDAIEPPKQTWHEKICTELNLKSPPSSILSNVVSRIIMKKEWILKDPDMKRTILVEQLSPSLTSTVQLWTVFSNIGTVTQIQYPADMKAFYGNGALDFSGLGQG